MAGVSANAGSDGGSTFIDKRCAELIIQRDEYTCPITKDLFDDPVVASDGHTYERSAITEHILRNGPRSPMTNQALQSTQFFPNHFCKQAIQRFRENTTQEIIDVLPHVLDSGDLSRAEMLIEMGERCE